LTVATASGVLANDTDADGNTLTASLVTGPAHGTLTLNANGSFTYTPTTGYTGADSFVYRAYDGKAYSANATVSLAVNVVSSVPAAPTSLTASAISASQINLTWVDKSNNETGFIIQRKTGANGTWAKVATAGANATTYQDSGLSAGKTYYYRVRSTNSVGSSTFCAAVSATTLPTNRAPVAAGDSYTMNMSTVLNAAAPGVLANDSDADKNVLTASLVTGPAHGTLTLNANGSFVYTPWPGFNGSDSFVYRAYDGTAYSANATVSFTVNWVDTAAVSLLATASPLATDSVLAAAASTTESTKTTWTDVDLSASAQWSSRLASQRQRARAIDNGLLKYLG
jgi:VCBS repeat-containing protein